MEIVIGHRAKITTFFQLKTCNYKRGVPGGFIISLYSKFPFRKNHREKSSN